MGVQVVPSCTGNAFWKTGRRMKLRMVGRSIRFWWQRLTRGWDDSDLWNLDNTLAKLILPRLRRFRDVASGYPADLERDAQWKTELAKMITAFETIADDERCYSPQEQAWVQEGLDLFAKRFRSLWD